MKSTTTNKALFHTPILLITFNRPNHTRQVWEAIKQQRPSSLYIFQDGSRAGNDIDIEKGKAVRAIFEEPLDWDCEIKTYYSDKNLGCGLGPSSAITWFFEQVEEGIIMEDDCLPHIDFFKYCAELLERFRYEEKVSFIGGANYQDGQQRGSGSYYFSAGHHATWGWASWRRTWNRFDYYLEGFTDKLFQQTVRNYYTNLRIREYWFDIYKTIKKNRLNESAWDYQFYFVCWKYKLLAVVPNRNLIANIGFDADATHTRSEDNKFAKSITESILPLEHCDIVKQNKKADNYLHKIYVQPYEFGCSGLNRLPYRINKRIKRLVGKKGSWIK